MFGWVRWVAAGLPFGSAMCVVDCEVQGGVMAAGRPDVCSGRIQPLWTVEGGPAVRTTLLEECSQWCHAKARSACGVLGRSALMMQILGGSYFFKSMCSTRRAPVAPTLEGDDRGSVNNG